MATSDCRTFFVLSTLCVGLGAKEGAAPFPFFFDTRGRPGKSYKVAFLKLVGRRVICAMYTKRGERGEAREVRKGKRARGKKCTRRKNKLKYT